MSSEFFSEDNKRGALVYQEEAGWCVDMTEEGVLMEKRSVYGRTRQYAEDLAENWVMKWGEFSDEG